MNSTDIPSLGSGGFDEPLLTQLKDGKLYDIRVELNGVNAVPELYNGVRKASFLKGYLRLVMEDRDVYRNAQPIRSITITEHKEVVQSGQDDQW